MSYTEFLRTKLASQPKVMAVRKPTDASVYTHKQRMAATGLFSFVDGTSVGTLVKQTDRPVSNNAAVSSKKASGKAVAASDFTTYAGSRSSSLDIVEQAKNGKKNLLCINPSINVPSPVWNYASGSDSMRSRKCVDTVSGVLDSPGAPMFQDNTISLSAMHPQKAIGCDENSKLEDANHTHSPGLSGTNSQPYAVGKPFFMANPPMPQAENTSPYKVGSYYSPLSGYVENKHGYVKPTADVPKAPGPQGQEIAHLKINNPIISNSFITSSSSTTQVIGTFTQLNSELANYDIAYNAFTGTWMVSGLSRNGGNIIFRTIEPITSSSVWTTSLNVAVINDISVMYALTFIQGTSTWLASGSKLSVFRSIDNGVTWTNENTGPFIGDQYFRSIATNSNGSRGIAVGSNGGTTVAYMYTYNSISGTWQEVTTNMPPNVVALNKVIYLPTVDRWIMVGASVALEPSIFRSDTNDPAGTWSPIVTSAYAGFPLRDVRVTNNPVGVTNRLLFTGSSDGISSFYTAEFTDAASLASITLVPFATTIFTSIAPAPNAYAMTILPNGGLVAGGEAKVSSCLFLNANGDGTTWVPITGLFTPEFTVRSIFAGTNNWMAVGDDSLGGRKDCVYVGTYV